MKATGNFKHFLNFPAAEKNFAESLPVAFLI
jgi:hypothetical protein